MKEFSRLFFLIYILVFTFELNGNVNKEEIFTAEEKAWIKKHNEIKVGSEKDWIPFDYQDDNGKHKGISQDYLDKVSGLSGLKFTVHFDTWSNLIDKIKSKEIDLLPSLYYSDERNEYIEFTNTYLKLAEYLFTLKETQKITSPSELHGKTLAVVKGYQVHDWLKKRHPKVKIVLKNTLLECIQALSAGEVYGYIGDLPSTQALQGRYFITNIKANTIVLDRDPVGLHMGARKDQKILATIISKAFDKISRKEKEEIFSKYANERKEKVGLRGAFGFGRPPYMYDRNSAKGIEEAIVRRALQSQGLKLLEVRQMPIERGQTVLVDNPEMDFSVGVLEQDDGLFYSQNFVKYENIAITRKSDKIKLNDVNDLLNYKVLAWSKAYNMLGSEFNKHFNPLDSPASYKEIFDQRQQHEIFFKKEADVIIVDKNIFDLYLNQLKHKYDTNQEYDFHRIFLKPTWVKVSFRDKVLRDSFDRGLQKLIENGMYDEIISKFLEVDLQKQLDLSQLLAMLSAKYMYEKNFKALEQLLTKFNKIDIIKGIEVLSKNDKKSVLKFEHLKHGLTHVDAFSWGDSQLNKIEKISYFEENGNTQPVGTIRVYFKVNDIKDIDISYIPNLEFFKDLKEDYKYITSVYRRLGLDFKTIQFSVEDQKWIQEHPKVSFVGDPNWLPFEGFDEEGKYIGIVAEYLAEIEKITGLTFERIATSSWEESITLMKDKKADMISETTDSEMAEYLDFTQAYLENHIVIVMNTKADYVDNLSLIQDKKIVIIKDYGYVSKIKMAYPDTKFIEVNDITEGLKFVSSGRADALLCTMVLGSHNINKDGFINLRIVGKTEFSTSLGYAIQPELKPLVKILNKAILILEEGKKQKILKKWVAQTYVEKIDYTLVWQILAASFILIALFYYWNRQMKKEIGLRKMAEGELQEVNDQVHKSIEFSSMIQRALIPTQESFENFFQDYFTVWKPRDTVGGDIYFFEELRHKDESILMVIDCTGHGVPGAFVSMLVKAIERNITGYIKKSDETVSPAKLLSVLNRSMKHLLKQHDKTAESNAGFDAAIVYINKTEQLIRYAGAEIALYYEEDTQIKSIKGDRHSIGYRTSKIDYIFKDHELSLDAVNKLYLSTDGYLDQNGGKKGFPFGKKKFKQILQDNRKLSMLEIEKILLNELETYQGDNEANDDITIVGVKI